MEGGDTMSDPIQLSENLTVLWEGDVEGYAPAIELWNRALVELERELKARGLVLQFGRLTPKILQDLVALIFEKVDVDNVRKLPPGVPMTPEIEVVADSKKYLICMGEGTSDGTQSMFELISSSVLRRPFDGVSCAINFEPVTNESLESAQRRPVEPHKAADTSMTAWLSYPGGSFGLRIGLRMGLHANAAHLSALKLVNTGPADKLDLDYLGPRMNIITGDNGLGKSFFLEAAWFMLTGHWHNLPAVVTKVENKAYITARLRQSSKTEVRVSPWLRREQGWASPREHTSDTDSMGFYSDLSYLDHSHIDSSLERAAEIDPGLIVYARVDGSFSVWDSHRNVQNTKLRDGFVLPPPRVFPFSFRDVMYGLTVSLDDKNKREVSLGLINEWREWQTGNKPQFELLKSILAALGPDGEPLTPGTPSRPYLDDAKDIPTIQMAYGQEVPITLAPAGVKRTAMLAYVLTWAISEHRRLVQARAGLPARSVILLIDEPETHLHPRWQRTILPSLLKALEVGFGEPKVDMQMFVATHSPLVLASLEPHFDPALDALWKLDLVDGEVKLERDVWHKRGDANAWLTSDVFDMSSSRSVEAEQALKRAKALALRGTATPEEIAEVQAELERSLTDTDRAWRAWESFVEHLGTQR